MSSGVAVIIPCYNQAVYLAEAIASAVDQTRAPREVVVIDDGSTDDTAAVARSFPTVRYHRQENRGAAAARNAGLRASSADLVVFLDADDRLLPGAIEAGADDLEAHPDCAMTFGRYGYLNMDRRERGFPTNRTVDDSYEAMLHQNFIVVPAAAMFRRSALEEIGGFDESMTNCEDYDLYLRIMRDWPTSMHDEVVAQYRRHDTNKSRNLDLIRQQAMFALDKQLPYVRGDRRRYAAYRRGERNCHIWFAKGVAFRAHDAARSGRWWDAARDLLSAARHIPLRTAPYVAAAITGGFFRWLKRTRSSDGEERPVPPRHEPPPAEK